MTKYVVNYMYKTEYLPEHGISCIAGTIAITGGG